MGTIKDKYDLRWLDLYWDFLVGNEPQWIERAKEISEDYAKDRLDQFISDHFPEEVSRETGTLKSNATNYVSYSDTGATTNVTYIY